MVHEVVASTKESSKSCVQPLIFALDQAIANKIQIAIIQYY